MSILVLLAIVFFGFFLYRKQTTTKILKEVKKKYEFSISNAISSRINLLSVKFSSGRMYFLENEIINFKKNPITELEQIVVHKEQIKKRVGVLKGNYFQLIDLNLTNGKSEFICDNNSGKMISIFVDTNEKEKDAIQKWKAKYFNSASAQQAARTGFGVAGTPPASSLRSTNG